MFSRLTYIHMPMFHTSTMTTTALAVDNPSHRRAESIISTEEMCICVCGGISTAIFCFCTTNSVDYQQIIERKKQRERAI